METAEGIRAAEGPYSVKQVARMLSVSLTTVYEEIARGELRAMAIGTGRGTYRVEQADFDAYKERCRARAIRIHPAATEPAA